MDVGQGAGALLGLPFKGVYDYLNGVKETREVQGKLGEVLQSLKRYADSTEASEKSAKAVSAWVDRINPPISAQDAEDWMRLSAKSCNDFAEVLASIRRFGRECNGLISGDFEGFVQKVKRRKPDIYDIINFFGRNYDSKTDSLNLTNLPMLIRLYLSGSYLPNQYRISD